jgi:hypothetical protein
MASSKFKPDTLHPDYVTFIQEWERIEDASNGEAAVKAKDNGRAYLTPTMGMSTAEFRLYVHLARFLPAIGKTLQAYNGLIHRKQGVLSGHESVSDELIKKLLNNFSRKHQTIDDFADELTLNYSKFKRGGALTEYPKVEKQPKNLKEFEDSGQLPYCRFFEARQIINWRTDIDYAGRLRLNLVVIKLVSTIEDPENEFADKDQTQYYILDLTQESGYDRLVYRKRIATKIDDNWQVDESIPIINNSPIFEIPFDFIGPTKPVHSDILPAVEVAFQLYTLSAALNWALHFIGLPTFYTLGVKDPEGLLVKDINGNERLPLGPSGGLHIPDKKTDAEVGMISYEGRGLDLIRDEIKDRRDELAALGSRMLTDERRGVEAEETARIHRSGENAGLTTTAKVCSTVLTKQLKRMLTWLGVEQNSLADLKYTLNTDYLPSTIDAQTLDVLFKMYLEGGLPLKDFLLNLKKGEIVDSTRTLDEFEAGLKKPEPTPQPVQIIQQPETEEPIDNKVDVVEAL